MPTSKIGICSNYPGQKTKPFQARMIAFHFILEKHPTFLRSYANMLHHTWLRLCWRSRLSLNNDLDNSKGFTLFEIVVVIFILSVIAAIVLPSITVMGTAKINSDAKRIASILRYLNDTAQTTKETASLKIDVKKRLLSYETAEGKKEEIFDTIRSVETQSRGALHAGEVTLFFHSTGAAENVEIHLSDERTNVAVSFNHLSGRVKITGL